MGIFEDMPIKVSDSFVPVDFVILNIEEDVKILIILGRLFMASTNCIIDVSKGKMIVDIEDEHIEIELHKVMKCSKISDSCFSIDTFDCLLHDVVFIDSVTNPLERCLM